MVRYVIEGRFNLFFMKVINKLAIKTLNVAIVANAYISNLFGECVGFNIRVLVYGKWLSK